MSAPRNAWLLLIVLLVLLVLPAFLSSYALSVAIAILYLAYAGQAWNVLMGFAGQLSLGHALYVGVGAYAAAALFTHYGIGPALGVWVAIVASSAFGALIGLLAFRFRVAGVYFVVLTLAFAEFTRIAFDHLEWFGGPAGLFLPVAQRDHADLLKLRGPPAMYYYTALALTLTAFALCAALLRSRAGYYWRAIREDEQAAAALGINTFRWKLLAIVLSSAMTGVAGVFLAFYKNSLFPEQVFDAAHSIEIMLGPIIGGLGTLSGPLLGALLLTLLSEGSVELLAACGLELPGTKQVIYGVLLLVAVSSLPHGIWPALTRLRGARRAEAA
jgi:branched-chain amino acid transport system permease protein